MGRRPLCVCLLFFLTVFLAVSHFTKDPESGGQKSFDGQPVRLCGIVKEIYESPDQTEKEIILYLKQVGILTSSVNDFSENGEKQNIEGAVCYLSDGESPPRVGAAVQIFGTAYAFEAATNPGEFDAASYYELRGYQIKVYGAQVEKQSASYDRQGQFFHELRLKIAGIYAALLGEKNGALASAMVLGRKKGIDDAVKALYQSAGISHILAISGLHISLVGSGIVSLLKRTRLPLWAAGGFACVLVCCYGMFTGMSVSTLRAVVMFLLVMAAQMLRRTPDTLTSLLVAAAAVLVWEPGYLQDSGFLLSFSAVAGMALLVPVLKDRGLKRPETPTLRQKILNWAYDGFCTSLGVALAMMPALLGFFYTWNPWSLVYNVAAVLVTGILLPQLFWLAGAGLVYGGITAVLGSAGRVGTAAALPEGPLLTALRLLAQPAKGLFALLEKGSALIQKLPGSCLHMGMPEIWQIVLFCLGLLLLILYGKKVRPGIRIPLAAALIGVFLIRLPGNLTVTMLDVGQGAGFVVQSPSHETYLLDAGSSSESGVGEYSIVPFLKYSGVKKLEAVFISHWDEDHMNGLADVLEWADWEHVPVGALVLPDIGLEDDQLKEVLELAENYGIPVKRMSVGDVWEQNNLRFRCLHPYEGEVVADRNASSMVLKLEYGSFSALFPGDLEATQEAWICQNFDSSTLDCHLLAAGHHGSATSSSESFLAAVSPAAALISCGENNRYGHPHPDTLERFAENGIVWYTTPQMGAVSVEVEAGKMRIRGFLPEAGR